MNDIIFLLMERNKKKRPWTEQEIELLAKLYPMQGSKKWKKISQGLRRKGFHRSEIEIRERWINFVDPTVNKSHWEEWELEKLYDIHDQVGTKWCVIQKFISRTQNMIKNRFYGTLRNYIRFLVSSSDHRRDSFNRPISKLSPKVLNDIYKAQNQFKFVGEEIKESIYAMRFKIDKKILTDRMKEKRGLYERLKAIIFKIFEQMKNRSTDTPSYDESSQESSEEIEEELVKQEQSGEEPEEEGSESSDQQEQQSEGEEGSLKQEVKLECSGVYPFLEKGAANMAFKVEEQPYYPFLNYLSFEAFEPVYVSLPTYSLP